MKFIFCRKETLDVQQHVFRRHFFTTPSSFQGLCCCYTMNVCILTADAVSPTYCWFLRVRRWKRRWWNSSRRPGRTVFLWIGSPSSPSGAKRKHLSWPRHQHLQNANGSMASPPPRGGRRSSSAAKASSPGICTARQGASTMKPSPTHSARSARRLRSTTRSASSIAMRLRSSTSCCPASRTQQLTRTRARCGESKIWERRSA